MQVTVTLEIEPKDLELNAGNFNRRMLKLAQDLHSQFLDRAVNLYKENKESIDLDSLPQAALPRWR